MRSNTSRPREFTPGLLFQIEQWIAFLLGIACLSVCLWAILDGQKAFSIGHLSHFSTTTLVSIGWFLTIFVGLSGVTLMRFAFYKISEMEDAKPPSGQLRLVSGRSLEESSRCIPITAGKRRR